MSALDMLRVAAQLFRWVGNVRVAPSFSSFAL
jgi:hypothetical protein